MNEFPIQTAVQFSEILRAFCSQTGMTQHKVTMRLGVTQQTPSALERNAKKVSAERLLTTLSILEVELVMWSRSPRAMNTTDW